MAVHTYDDARVRVTIHRAGGNRNTCMDSCTVRDKAIVWLTIVFVVSRFWVASIGVKFDDYRHPAENLVHIMQLMPTEAMETNLWETIIYDHAQPPLYSILMYLTKMNSLIVHCLWMLMGLTAGYAIYALVSGMGASRTLAFLAACAWMLSPATILFESTIIYEMPVACMIIFAAWALSRCHLVTYSWLCCAIVMTRSLFHPILFLLPMLGIGWWSTRK